MSSVSFVISCKTVRFSSLIFLRLEFVTDQTFSSIVDLLQVLSILTMERPVSFSSEDIRDEKVSFTSKIESSDTSTDILSCGLLQGQGAPIHSGDQA